MDRVGHYLADVCREVREQAGANRSVIAAQFNASEWTVRRFEMQQGKWSAQTDELVAAYAHMAGVEPADLWQRAIDAWRLSAAQESTPAAADRPATGEGTPSAQDKANKLLDSAGRKSQKRARQK